MDVWSSLSLLSWIDLAWSRLTPLSFKWQKRREEEEDRGAKRREGSSNGKTIPSEYRIPPPRHAASFLGSFPSLISAEMEGIDFKEDSDWNQTGEKERVKRTGCGERVCCEKQTLKFSTQLLNIPSESPSSHPQSSTASLQDDETRESQFWFSVRWIACLSILCSNQSSTTKSSILLRFHHSIRRQTMGSHCLSIIHLHLKNSSKSSLVYSLLCSIHLSPESLFGLLAT